MLTAQQAAWNKGDMDAYVGFYKNAPDSVAMLAGPVRGVEAIRAAFPHHGLDPDRLHFDSFDYAPDTLARIEPKR